MAYPPPQEDVLAPLIRWLNDQRKRAYRIIERPDLAERRQPAVDYVLRDDASGHEAAVEVSTVWRSADAGREDREWTRWTERVAAAAHGKLPAEYHVYTPLQAPAVEAERFAAGLVTFATARATELAELGPQGKGLHSVVEGVPIFIAAASSSRGEVSFARDGRPMKRDEFATFVGEILDKKIPKLQEHKDRGRETWLLLYNTVWPVYNVRDVVAPLIAERHAPVDHIAVVSGNPPDDCWVDVVWSR